MVIKMNYYLQKYFILSIYANSAVTVSVRQNAISGHYNAERE